MKKAKPRKKSAPQKRPVRIPGVRNVTARPATVRAGTHPVPVVGTGASAGGPEVFTQVLQAWELTEAQWNAPRLRELLDDMLPKNSRFGNFRMDGEICGVGRKNLMLNARRIEDDSGTPHWIWLAIQEVQDP